MLPKNTVGRSALSVEWCKSKERTMEDMKGRLLKLFLVCVVCIGLATGVALLVQSFIR
jgi:NADH:ubiquinone oxidoreductase subunit K